MRPNPKQLVDFFSRSLSSFHSSPDVFRVLCTLPHHGGSKEPAPRPSNSKQLGQRQRLVVLDSSFNPPTRAHAEMAKSALEWASSSSSSSARLMLLLSVNNADKAPKPASFPTRLGMMEGFGHELLKDFANANEGPDIDLAVTKMPYFHDKARVIAESGFYAGEGNPAPEQIFLAGFDTVIRIFNPKYYGSEDGGMKAALGPFFENARLRVTMRTDDEWGGEDEQVRYVKGLGEGGLDEVGGDKDWAGKVDLVEGRKGGVSSSRVRELVKSEKREGLEGMVDGEVLAWIDGEGLYRE
ncbi:hypothetical protein TGAMA5MH_06889 [Trichoderma gamsii]|uniref:Nicotinamide-nucleotide adenylyltransferase n=1 Tax=Trichoderma gamsii TaxID=398673 RepID=A0A2K0T664_9HYPO|nr:hypothetical protein TGAMA5MH_06889 [Trichoderma gamsii]